MEVKSIASSHIRLSPEGDFKAVYANNANVTITPFDLTIEYGVSKANDDGSVIYTRPKANIVMSIEHARALADALQATIRRYDSGKKQGAKRKRK